MEILLSCVLKTSKEGLHEKAIRGLLINPYSNHHLAPQCISWLLPMASASPVPSCPSSPAKSPCALPWFLQWQLGRVQVELCCNLLEGLPWVSLCGAKGLTEPILWL